MFFNGQVFVYKIRYLYKRMYIFRIVCKRKSFFLQIISFNSYCVYVLWPIYLPSIITYHITCLFIISLSTAAVT